MANEWVNRIYETETGDLVATVPCSESRWETRMTGYGQGRFVIRVYGSGISRDDLTEWTRPNAYTITEEWAPTDHVAFAGVIQADEWGDSDDTVTVDAQELRGAYFNSRMLWSLPEYNSEGGGSVALSVTSKSRAGAVRAVISTSMFPGPGGSFPIDLPADGSGGFSATWLKNERLYVEDHLRQIEEDGCETYWRPYRTGGNLRWETLVEDGKLQYGDPTVFPIRGGDSPIRNLRVRRDGVKQMTGVAVFGEGGKSALVRTAPETAPIEGWTFPFRDVWIDRPDINSASALQVIGNQQYAVLQYPSEGWEFDLHVYPDGPEFAGVGRILWAEVGTHPRLTDGSHHKRVIALRGNKSMFVSPEVDDAD